VTAPVEKFPPTSGTVTGSLGVAMAAVVGVVSVVTSPDLAGVRILLGAALAGVLIWMVVLRPRAAVYDDVLLLRQEVSDTWVPLTLIDTVHAGRDLVVAVDDQRYRCTGISRSRPLPGTQRRGTVPGAPDAVSHVENRIREMVAAAHRRDQPDAEQQVRRRWAVAEFVALAVLGAGFLVSLLL
jgi:hypothetical protein